MGLVDGTAIVTAAEVAEITHEDELSNLSGSSSTIDNACKWATSWLIDELDARGIPCDKIANPARLKRTAAYVAAAHALHGARLGDEADKRADDYLAQARELVLKYRFVSSDAPGPGTTSLILPAMRNQDDTASFGSMSSPDPLYPPPSLIP